MIRREVEALLSQVVDFDSFARSVMAVHYRKASPEQRERFAETFKCKAGNAMLRKPEEQVSIWR